MCEDVPFSAWGIDFAVCALLLTWNCRTSEARPLRQCGQCAALFKTLLLDVSGLLKNEVLWHGIRSDRILPTSSSDTVLACAPALRLPMCRIQRNGSYSQNECFKNIEKDLTHYEAIISSYIRLELRSPDEEMPPLTQTLQIIQNLLKSCPFTSTEKSSVKDASRWEDSSYSNRGRMLEMMRAFHIRTITFNRAVGYIASGEHKNPRSS
ncbi:interleukin-12 subunit alpha [Eucyclogobius newberryi]|uniref:interleukin-12 subunit alpha n=1 Tax=Eucyclogobius newberryi TaxID=166745 RepID=UPI003B598478